jgi:hypothetical protein
MLLSILGNWSHGTRCMFMRACTSVATLPLCMERLLAVCVSPKNIPCAFYRSRSWLCCKEAHSHKPQVHAGGHLGLRENRFPAGLLEESTAVHETTGSFISTFSCSAWRACPRKPAAALTGLRGPCGKMPLFTPQSNNSNSTAQVVML